MRDPHSVDTLAQQIVEAIDGDASAWKKWSKVREELLRAASACWIPLEDLRTFLAELPGPKLTHTDVAQRLRAIHEEPYSTYPDERLRDGCLALYEREKAEGTELPAIIGALQEFVEAETERQRLAWSEELRRRREEEQLNLEQRFLSGADCKWTTIAKSRDFYIRKNGRAYRLCPRKDKRWELYRIKDVEDSGSLVGAYGSRTDASKALGKIAYEAEPRW